MTLDEGESGRWVYQLQRAAHLVQLLAEEDKQSECDPKEEMYPKAEAVWTGSASETPGGGIEPMRIPKYGRKLTRTEKNESRLGLHPIENQRL